MCMRHSETERMYTLEMQRLVNFIKTVLVPCSYLRLLQEIGGRAEDWQNVNGANRGFYEASISHLMRRPIHGGSHRLTGATGGQVR